MKILRHTISHVTTLYPELTVGMIASFLASFENPFFCVVSVMSFFKR